MKLFVILFAITIQAVVLASTGLAAEQASDRSAVLLVTDHTGELPALTTLLEKNGYDVTLRPQKEIDSPITGYHAVFVYVHKVLLPKAETELVNYAKGGGRLVVIHHGLASAKAANPKWLELLGVKFYPRNDKKYPWCVTEPTTFTVVNLMPEHYITSHKVNYDKTVAYQSQSRADLAGEFPAFDLPNTEVYHNMRSTDGNEKVILFGSKFKPDDNDPAAANKPLMEETAGWYKQTGKGWTFYFQMGHSEDDFRNPNFAQVLLNCLAWQPNDPKYAAAPTVKPLFKTVDLNVGESAEVELAGGKKISLKLVDLKQKFDSIRHAVRSSKVTVEIDGKPVELGVATYTLPITIKSGKGTQLQIDCPVAGEYVHQRSKSKFNPWQLNKDARLRIWPAGSPWVRPETYGYHINGGWFFSDTQMGSDPCYVDAGDKKKSGNIYYHYGLDVGGNEGQQEIVAAADGVVVSAREAVLPGYAKKLPVAKRYDVVYVLDRRGWFYRYSHFHTIYDSIQPGRRVKQGQPLGLLGKEGASGGWTHSHYDVNAIQPTGGYGIEEAYPFMWQAYRDASGTKLEAIARPHHLLQRGEEATLDGSRSWSAIDKEDSKKGIVSYEWIFSDGTTAQGPQVTRRYDTPGSWSETLKVTDREGRVDYDFCVVLVTDLEHKECQYPPTIHATFYPTTDIKAGDPVTFKVRSFGIDAKDGHEEWDFGDGTPKVQVQSDGNQVKHAKDGYAVTTHCYAKPGSYLVSVRRTNRHGQTAIGRLHVVVK